MPRSLLARLLAGLLIVVAALALTFSLDGPRAFALADELSTAPLHFQQNDHLFYASVPEGGDALYVSLDGREWQSLSAPLARPIEAGVLTHDGTLYLAADQTLYATRNGQQWDAATRLEGPVRALAADPAVPSALYAITEQGNLYHIDEQGRQLLTLNSQPLPGAVRDLAVNPLRPQSLYLATDQGLFRSENGGVAWEPVPEVGVVSQLLFSQAAPHLLLAATRDNGILRSMDGGLNWEAANEGLGTQAGARLQVTALSEDPLNPGLLYVATAYLLGSNEQHLTPAALYLSPDAGTQWIQLSELPLNSSPVSLILPEPRPGAGLQIMTTEGSYPLHLDPDRALRLLEAPTPAEQLKGMKLLSISALPSQAEALLPYLEHEDGQLAYYAARALGHIGDERVREAMVQRIEGESDTIVKLRALMVLADIADPATLPTLRAAFQEPVLARSAADALIAIGSEEAMAPLTQALADEALSPHRQAAMAVFELNSARALPYLVALLDDPNPTMRANSAQTLAWMGEQGARPALRALLDDPVAEVRAQAAFALGKLNDTESLARLESLSRQDAEPRVQAAAQQAIEEIQSPVVLPTAPPRATTAEWPGSPSDLSGWLKVLLLVGSAMVALFLLAANPRRSPLAHTV